MTLDEAIKHHEEMAEVSECASKMLSHDAFWHSDPEYSEECRVNAIASAKSSKEDKQIAEWLRELKDLREKVSGSDIGRICELEKENDKLKADIALMKELWKRLQKDMTAIVKKTEELIGEEGENG